MRRDRQVEKWGPRPKTAIGQCSVCGRWIVRNNRFRREMRNSISRNGGPIKEREYLVCASCVAELDSLREQARALPVRCCVQVHHFCGEGWPVKSRR